MIFKKWWEDWEIIWGEIHSDKKYRIQISLPRSAVKPKEVFELVEGDKLTRDKLVELNGILTSAFHQIQRDHGGYENERKKQK